MSTEHISNSIPRSASYVQLPATPSSDISPERSAVKRTFSENLIANPKTNNFRHGSIKKGFRRSMESTKQAESLGTSRSLSMHAKTGPKITVSGFRLGVEEDDADYMYRSGPKVSVNGTHDHVNPRPISGSFARLKRQSWIASTRSPSPNKTPGPAPTKLSSSTPDTIGDVKAPAVAESGINQQPEDVGVKHTKSRRRISSYLSMTSLSESPRTPAIPKSLSTDRLPLSNAHTSSEKPPALPNSKSFERLNALGTESPRRKDELWSAFRSLDADFQKFQSRPSNLKCTVVRTSLLPFLRSHAEPIPNFTLRPEDLDRRINVLNRWWTGLLEMINGRNGESVSGSDRPTVLDAITAIMIRPEWNVSPSTSLSRSPKPSLKSRSTTSLRSTTSDFLTESVMHNIRNTYVQNLLAQMAFVVNRLSIRSVPASVVVFCGKAIAYAFYYCDGVAEILVRLWSLSSDVLKRACEAGGVGRGASLSLASERISARFPSCVQKLAFNSPRSMIRYLRSRPQVPIATNYIPWEGPWTGRWAGRDTDLFFSFTKQYYDLLSQYLPEDVSKEEMLCAPGHALVQAQLLSLLDSTMLYGGNQPVIDQFKGHSFDDVLVEADASAAVLPISPNTLARSMAENRLIMLLRDCLSANATTTSRAKGLLAKVFEGLLKATARRTSQFDHLACFTLCDFLDEAVVILVRFHQSTEPVLENFDWPFWIRVCELMMASTNSMTVIRLCTLLYSLWNTIVDDEDRKRSLCLGWLLSEETFGRQFNHWCPMVRAYFMRLLVWRLGRLDATTSEVNMEILRTLWLRLHEAWRTFLFLQDDAERNGLAAPTTAPCSPAPSRCLLIIRNEAPTPPTYLSFDSILPPSQLHNAQSASHRDSLFGMPPPPSQQNSNKEARKPSSSGKRRWGLLRSMIPFTSSLGKFSPADSPTPESIAPIIKADSPNKSASGSASSANLSTPATVDYRTHSFKFSLEWLERGQLPSRDRKLFPPRLPPLAQTSLRPQHKELLDYGPMEPKGIAIGESKYVGRALAEWALLIAECYSFFERRKQEGVPNNSKVETPTLCVEPFRKP